MWLVFGAKGVKIPPIPVIVHEYKSIFGLGISMNFARSLSLQNWGKITNSKSELSVDETNKVADMLRNVEIKE